MRPLAGRALAVALLALTGVAAPMGAASAGTQPLRVAATPATHAPTLAATPQAARLAAEPRPAAKPRPATKRRPRPHGLGARRPATRLAAARTLPLGRTRVAALPVSADLSSGAPAIGDQGQVGSCGPWAIGYSIMGYYAKTQPHTGAPFSAMSLYNEVNGGRDVGTSVFALYDALHQKGIAEQAVWSHRLGDVASRPTTAEAANALTHRTTGGTVLFLGDRQGDAARTAIQTALAAGHPVAIGLPVYDAFFRLAGRDSVMTARKAAGTNYGGHEVAAYGYDATGIKIANSWGRGWGNAGWATLGWDFVDRYVFEASTPGTFTVSSPAAAAVPPPADVAVAAGTRIPAATGAVVTVTGTGFGTTKADVTGGALTATVNGARAATTWLSPTQLRVVVPPGTPGASASIAVARQGVSSAAVSVPYVASITGMTVTTGSPSGGTVTQLAGRGFAGASTWALTAADGTVLAALPVVTSLDGVPAGVVLLSDTAARVKLPPAAAPFLPVVVTFTPDPKAYPGAVFVPSSGAVFTYSDLG